ncbi:MAG: rhodanese-like domain-containing protein [Deltaproteobacteria bacterium]|nr:rhodanese-like domain-containing protein [Deltaproteobacteria bacterium]
MPIAARRLAIVAAVLATAFSCSESADTGLEQPDASASAPDAAAWMSPHDAGAPTLGVISVADLHSVLTANSKDFLLINVHVPFEGDLPGTDRDLPYSDVDGLAAHLGSDLSVRAVVYCKTNHMSTSAGAALVARGYRAIRYLDGGMNAWVAAGHPLAP